MKKNKELLEVGDKIAVLFVGKIKRIITIERVTKTLAFCEDKKFRRSYDGGRVMVVPHNSFSATKYKLATDEHFKEYEKFKKLNFIRNFYFSTLSTEKLTKIYNILKQEE